MTPEELRIKLSQEPLTFNELLQLEKLVERMQNEIKLEARSDSDFRLCINHLKNEKFERLKLSIGDGLFRNFIRTEFLSAKWEQFLKDNENGK